MTINIDPQFPPLGKYGTLPTLTVQNKPTQIRVEPRERLDVVLGNC